MTQYVTIAFAIIALSFLSCSTNAEIKRTDKNEKPISWSAETINEALTADFIRWEGSPNVNTEYTRYGVLNTGKALNYLALVAFYDAKNQYPQAAKRVVEQLRYVISGGKEPNCRGTIAGWADNSLAQTMALAKNTKSVWNQFTPEELEKLNWLMKALTVAGNYCQNSQNQIFRCLYQSYDWRKGWNPNHQEGYVGVMIAAWKYFGGADAVNQILKDFSYDEYMGKFTVFGFTNVLTCWQATGKELMEKGGKDSGGGTTMGVKIPFKYSSLVGLGELEYDPYLLYRDLAVRMFKYQVTSSGCDGKAYILDGTKSPYEGQMGMCYEFQTTDAYGCRSAARYVYDGWCNNILTAASMQAFGLWPDGTEKNDIMAKMKVGSSDLVYKLKHGYRDYKNGKHSDEYDTKLSGLGYSYVSEIYQKVILRN